MALAKWMCLECEKEFKAGSWTCQSGAAHRVAVKRYYMNDAPTVVVVIGGKQTINKRDSGTLVMNIPPETRSMGVDGTERITPGGNVQFIRGMFETSDPVQQFWLDQHKGIFSGEEGRKIWEAAYLNDDEKHEVDRMNWEAERSRLESERNSLLERVQARQ